MEGLIDLIFDNLWLVIILFGVFSSLIGGDKKKEKQKPYSETTQMPPIRPVKQTERKITPVKPHDVNKTKEVIASASKSTLQAKEELSTAYNYLTEKQETKHKQTQQTRSNSTESKTVEDKRGTFSQNEVVNGIIMAEILGAPRAKRPYSRARR